MRDNLTLRERVTACDSASQPLPSQCTPSQPIPVSLSVPAVTSAARTSNTVSRWGGAVTEEMMLHSHTQQGCRFTKHKGVAQLQRNASKSAYVMFTLEYRELPLRLYHYYCICFCRYPEKRIV